MTKLEVHSKVGTGIWHWIVIKEIVECTLDGFCKRRSTCSWHSNSTLYPECSRVLYPKSRQFAKDIIQGILFLHNSKKLHGCQNGSGIVMSDLLVCEDGVKFGFLCHDYSFEVKNFSFLAIFECNSIMQCLCQFLNEDPAFELYNREFADFKAREIEDKLIFHPILLDENKRFSLPNNAKVYFGNLSVFEQQYFSLSSADEYKHNPWSSRVPQRGPFYDVYMYSSKPNVQPPVYDGFQNISAFYYARNVIEHLRRLHLSKNDIVAQLNRICPGYLLDIYEAASQNQLEQFI